MWKRFSEEGVEKVFQNERWKRFSVSTSRVEEVLQGYGRKPVFNREIKLERR